MDSNEEGGLSGSELPQNAKRSFTASGWRKYQMRQRVSQDHISSEEGSSEEVATE